MTLRRFQELVETYGSTPSRWPETERSLYTCYAESDPGRTMLAEAERVDALLRNYTVSTVLDADFSLQLYAIAGTMIPAHWERRFIRVAGVSFAACVMIGLFMGGQMGYQQALDSASVGTLSGFIFAPVILPEGAL